MVTMLTSSSPQQRYNLVVRRMAEVNGGQAIEEAFAAGKSPKTFWGKAVILLHYTTSNRFHSLTEGHYSNSANRQT